MAQQKTVEELIKDLQQQISLLQQQTSLLSTQTGLIGAQVSNQITQQTMQSVIDKAVADKLKELAESEFALDKARAKGPFAELTGIKEALSAVPIQGKEGTISVSKGTDGALLLRVKKEMLEAMDGIAGDLIKALPGETGFVVASKGDLEASYRSQILIRRIDAQQRNLQEAFDAVQPDDTLEGLAAGLAAVQTAGLVFGALSDFGKFFRTDRTFSVFDAGDEAQQALELLLENKARAAKKKVVIRLDEPTEDVIAEANSLIARLDAFKKVYDVAAHYVATAQRASDDAAKLPPDQRPQLPSASALASLKAEVENSKALLESINPTKNSDAFWSQVAGQVKHKRIADNNRLAVNVRAQTVQLLEKRTWRSDRLLGSGEVQVHYRLTSPRGEHLASGVLLRTSARHNAFSEDEKVEFPRSSTTN